MDRGNGFVFCTSTPCTVLFVIHSLFPAPADGDFIGVPPVMTGGLRIGFVWWCRSHSFFHWREILLTFFLPCLLGHGVLCWNFSLIFSEGGCDGPILCPPAQPHFLTLVARIYNTVGCDTLLEDERFTYIPLCGKDSVRMVWTSLVCISQNVGPMFVGQEVFLLYVGSGPYLTPPF